MISKLPNHGEHQHELRQMLTEVVRIVANKPDLEVTTELSPAERLELLRSGQNPDDVWYRQTEYDPVTGKVAREHVRVPENVLEGDELPALGIAAHEGAHSAITRLKEAGAERYTGELGFSAVMMALEERPTDHEVRTKFSGAGEWLDLARFMSSEKSREARLAVAGSKAEENNVGRPDKLAQICNLIVYQPHSNDWSGYDSEVLAKYEEIRRDVEFVEGCLPASEADEAERVRQATVRLEVLARKIWPKLKDLVDESLQEQQIQQLLASILSGQISLGQSESAGGEAGVIINLPPDLAAELAKKLKSYGSTKDLSKLPHIDLNPEQIQALKEVLAKLPDLQKQEIEEKALREMEKSEQKIVDQHAPKIAERPATPYEKRLELEENLKKHQEEERIKEKKQIEDKIRAEQEEVRKLNAKLLEEKSAYDEAYDQVRDLDRALYNELKEIFHPITKTKTRIRTAGAKLNLPAVFRWEAARAAGQNPAPRIFESTERPDKKDYAITLLIDLSGSMSGEKIEQTFLATVLLAESLNRLGLKLEILGFQDELIVFKKFQEKLDEKLRRKISGMPAEVDGDNPDGHNVPSYNDDGPCLAEAAKLLNKEQADNKFLIVLSDGLPEGRRSTEYDLHKAVENINKGRKISLIALGLGNETEHVKKFYPTSIPNIQADQLGEVLPELIKDILQNPRKYRIG